MTIQLSTNVRNARLDAIETVIGTAPRLVIYTGAQPANCAAAASGTVLATIVLPSDWMNAASSGSKTLLGSWTVAASGTGTAAHYRIYDSTVTTCHLQGSVTATGGGGDMTVDNTSIAAGQTVTVTSYALNEPNA
jgi:hypothetical protein